MLGLDECANIVDAKEASTIAEVRGVMAPLPADVILLFKVYFSFIYETYALQWLN